MTTSRALGALSDHALWASEDQCLRDALDLLKRVSPSTHDHFLRSLTSVALRAVETRILSDHPLRLLALNWDAKLADAEGIIESAVWLLTGEVAERETVQYLKQCIKSASSRKGVKDTIGAQSVEDAVDAAIARSDSREIRCFWCGYHFCDRDVGASRRDTIERLNGVLAKYPNQKRIADRLKPASVKSKSLCELTIDHVTPEAGLGWTEHDNLAVLCSFCNGAKLIYRSPFEPISTVVAASLQAVPELRGHSLPRQLAVWAAIASQQSCSACQRTVKEVELTVDAPSESTGRRWLVAGDVPVKCYDCVA
jgi:hypothetical protein